MESLQIQDAFAPYYAARPAKTEKTAKRLLDTDARTAQVFETRARLEACRDRLARAIAAAKADRQ
ncbi:hypothetical protein RB623_04525 [Mesorhizobium sp. LHD-90]|uniref:hypothetical protein n=1 Tax=Mesorhizobium sp. LHD-90 TaxID=3071414 RepID=UPI0027E1403F|nr:hypothetical protein [Mesorhizobium sp. LHD-90]MDQ6433312.1 hypothetical protein [Mesorhizobium sp. LHD-90]